MKQFVSPIICGFLKNKIEILECFKPYVVIVYFLCERSLKLKHSDLLTFIELHVCFSA